MLSDDEGAARTSMLSAVGLKDKGGRPRRQRLRTELNEEGTVAPRGARMSVDALLRPLDASDPLRKQLARGEAGVQRRTERRSTLSAPLEPVLKKRVERQETAAAMHRDISGWGAAVDRHAAAEALSFPLDRQAVRGTSLGTLSSTKALGELEEGVEALLEEDGLGEVAMASAERAALAQLGSSAPTADEAKRRFAELRKMRDLLFYHESKAKRIAKIKSKSYRKVHKKRASAGEEGAGGDEEERERARKQEVERVRERMTLKHKNTSRWARHALKQQKHLPHLASAVQEQIARGEELRRKQIDAHAKDSEEGDTSEEDDSEGEGDGGLWKLQNEDEPDLPKKGVFSMGFMQRAMEKKKQETALLLEELQEQGDGDEAASVSSEGSCDVDDGDGDGDDQGGVAAEDKPQRSQSRGKRGRVARGRMSFEPTEGDALVGLMAASSASEVVRSSGTRASKAGASTIDVVLPLGSEPAAVDAPNAAKKLKRPRGGSGARDTGADFDELLDSSADWIGAPAAVDARPTAKARPTHLIEANAPAAASVAAVAPNKRTKSAMRAETAGTSGSFVMSTSAPADTDAALIEGASLLEPSSAQQRLVNAAFPAAVADDFAAEKARLLEQEAPIADKVETLPGWGDWVGLGAKPSRRREEEKAAAAAAREKQLKEAADRRRDAALKNVIISEKRDKKASKFTVSGVPFPFKTREQFERSVRTPLGPEWNTVASHGSAIAPRVKVAKGAIIEPIPQRLKAAGKKRRT